MKKLYFLQYPNKPNDSSMSKDKAIAKLLNSRKSYERFVCLKMECDAVLKNIPMDKQQKVFCTVGVGFDDIRKKMYYCIDGVAVIKKALEKLIELQIEPNAYTKAGKLLQKYCDGEPPTSVHQATNAQSDVLSTNMYVYPTNLVYCIMTSNMFLIDDHTISELALQDKDKALAIFIGFAAYIPTMSDKINEYLLQRDNVIVNGDFDYGYYNARKGTELKQGETKFEIGCPAVITAVVGVTLLMYTEPNDLKRSDKIEARIKSIFAALCMHKKIFAPLSFWNAMIQVIKDCPLLRKSIFEALRELKKSSDRIWSNFARHVIDLSKKKEMTHYECCSLFADSENITDAHDHPKIIREIRKFKKREKKLREFCEGEGYDIWYYRVYCPNGKLSIVNDLVNLLGAAKTFCSIHCNDAWKGINTRKEVNMTFWEPLVRDIRKMVCRYSKADLEDLKVLGIGFDMLITMGFSLESSNESGCVFSKIM